MKDKIQKRLLTVSFTSLREYNGGSIIIPYFRLSAKWLFSAGFRSGDILQIEITDNILTISKAHCKCQKVTTKIRKNLIHIEVPASIANPE